MFDHFILHDLIFQTVLSNNNNNYYYY
jgi:hypothetical protein